jgi:hypothetical protein
MSIPPAAYFDAADRPSHTLQAAPSLPLDSPLRWAEIVVNSELRSDNGAIAIVFENLESGAAIDEIMEWFDVTREQVMAVLEFVARSLQPPTPHLPVSRSEAPVGNKLDVAAWG